MTRCLLSIGANSPDAMHTVECARRWLCAMLSDPQCSDIYSTPALNGKSPDYLNMVVRGYTDLEASTLCAMCKEQEAKCGRSPLSKQRGVVELDIDLVQYGNVILRPADLMRPYVQRGLQTLASG